MKTISPPGSQDNGFVATHAFEHLESVHHVSRKLARSYCGDNGKGT